MLIFLTAAGLVGMFILFPIAAEFGKRSKSEWVQGAAETSPAQ